MNPTIHTDTQNPECTPWRDDLKAYLDGELAGPARAKFERHLSTCSACQEELDIMREIQEELRADEPSAAEGVSAALRSRILEAAADLPGAEEWTTTPSPVKAVRGRGPWMNKALLYGGAVMTAVIVLAGVATHNGGSGSSPVGVAPPSETQFNGSSNDEQLAPGAPPPVAGAAPAESRPNADARAKQAPQAYARHLDGDNYAFVDGHVKWLQSSRAASKSDSVASGGFTFGYGNDSPSAQQPQGYSANGAADAVAPLYRQVHRSARLAVNVTDAEASSNSVEQLVITAGGYVETNSLSTGTSGLRSASLELKVPVDRFQATIRQISALGTVKDKSVESQDITEDSAAAKARVGVMDRELAVGEARLTNALNRAKKKRNYDTYEVRAEVRQLRIEAAEAKARRDYLAKLANFSELSVTLNEKQPVVKASGFWNDSGKSVRDAWASAKDAFQLPLKALIWILAYSPFWIPVILLWRKYGRNRIME